MPNRENFTVRLPAEKKRQLFDFADRKGMNATNVVRAKIYEMLEEEEQNKTPHATGGCHK